MNVLHLSTSDLGGGAAIAAYRLHGALKRCGVTSRMVVRERKSADTDVIPAQPSGSNRSLLERLQAKQYSLERRWTAKAPSRDLCFFSDDRVPGPNRLRGLPKADVLNLHWVAHLLDYGRFFRSLAPGQPLVWTLHDMAPMTGGCHYAMSCDRFTAQCGACPLMGSSTSRDLTRRIHDRKAAALQNLSPEKTVIVAPSNWLAEQARKSALLGRFDVEVVPNGLDIEMFAPRDKAAARELLGFPQDTRIVLFAADHVGDHRKGMDLLRQALEGMSVGPSVTLVAIGSAGAWLPAGSLSLGRIENGRLMSYVYSAADVFVLPTRADNLPNVLVEALACGVPCVSFRVGGVTDVVQHGMTGILAEPEDVASLRDNLTSLLADEDLRAGMGRNGREAVLRQFADTLVADQYTRIYEQLIEARETCFGPTEARTNAR